MKSLLSLSLILVGMLSADTITLRSGRILNGTYIGGTARDVRVDMGDHVENIPVDQISSLQFDATAAAPLPPPPPPPADADRTQLKRREPTGFDRFSQPEQPPGSPQASVFVPSGTPLTVSMIDAVDSQSARLGDRFRASIEDPVVINGVTLIPRGTEAMVRLIEDKQSGKISGRTVLTLGLTDLTVNGRRYDVTTGDVQQASESRGARSGKVIGGTTALGAIIGAVAGGGKGAAIGAASGAAVGTGAEIATKGQRVKIPSEARLTFTLSSDLRF